MTTIKKLSNPVFLIETTLTNIVSQWFHGQYWNEETKLRVSLNAPVHPKDYDGFDKPGYDWKGWTIVGQTPLKPQDRGYAGPTSTYTREGTVGSIRVYNSGEIMLFIQEEYGYMFDDAMAIYRKMERS
jgi:hypothetical protein